MQDLDLFELQLLPYFKLNKIIFKELKKPNVNFNNISLLFDVMKVEINIKEEGTGNTPLHYSSMFNNKKLTEYLLDKGSDVNVQNNAGISPLHFACHLLCKDIILLLIDRDANVNLLDDNQENPLMLYVQKGTDKSIVEILIKSGTDLNHKNYYDKNIFDLVKHYKNEQALSVLSSYIEKTNI